MAKASAIDSTEETRSVPRSRKGVRTRARLVDAAKQVFERDGFLDARIVDIAETAGLAPGTFYHYFDSKEQIFREVAEAQEERLTAPPDDAAAEVDPTPTSPRSAGSAAPTCATSSATATKPPSWA